MLEGLYARRIDEANLAGHAILRAVNKDKRRKEGNKEERRGKRYRHDRKAKAEDSIDVRHEKLHWPKLLDARPFGCLRGQL